MSNEKKFYPVHSTEIVSMAGCINCHYPKFRLVSKCGKDRNSYVGYRYACNHCGWCTTVYKSERTVENGACI